MPTQSQAAGIALPDDAQAVMRQVTSIVSPVYLVGGSVRDMALGLAPKDYDFTTPCSPDEIEAVVRAAGRRPFVAGKRFGTIGFKVGPHLVEVTTFRSESYRPGSRKPDVAFVHDITHDLSRRDFTINAMAIRQDGRVGRHDHGSHGYQDRDDRGWRFHVVDPFGGGADLRRRLIRTVGQAGERFREDPLRMLRAARFAAQLDFGIDPDTELRSGKRAADILSVSKERWVQELDKLLVAGRAARGLDFLARTRLLQFMLPEVAIQIGFDQDSPYHQLDLWQHTVRTVALTPPDLTLRWAALLHDAGKPFVRRRNRRGYSNYTYHEIVGAEMVRKMGTYLKWPARRTADVEALVRGHLEDGSPLRDADSAARFAA